MKLSYVESAGISTFQKEVLQAETQKETEKTDTVFVEIFGKYVYRTVITNG